MFSRNYSLQVALIAYAMLATSHAEEPEAADVDRLKSSLTKWEQTRQETGGNYSYHVSRSYFTGQRIVTTITVRGNKVAERSYMVMDRPVPVRPSEEPPVAKPQWVETGKELGSHKEGAPVRTVDELYADAEKLVGVAAPEHHQRQLGFDKQGLLSHCFLRDSRIADDAPIAGVPLMQIQLPLKK